MEFRDLKKLCAVNLRYNFFPHFTAAVLLAFLTPLIFSVEALDAERAARPLEVILSLTGTICLTPVFLPEQEEGIRDTVRMRKTDYLAVSFLRVCYSFLGVCMIFGCFVLFMYERGSEVTFRHFAGGAISAFYLGAAGLAAAGISQNTILGYLVSFLCYLVNFGGIGKAFLANFDLFSMSRGSFQEKYWLFLAGVIFISVTFWIKKRRDE